MSNGEENVAISSKVSAICKKLSYISEASRKNRNLSSDIRTKLLGSDSKKAEEPTEEERPKETGQLNIIIDNLQTILNLITDSNSSLISVNKEL